MGLAPLLTDTYRKYKTGTNNFVQWLAETARATGSVDKIFKSCPQQGIPPTGGRLKGKARKEAKKAGLTPAVTTYQVSINSFGTLAKAIACAKDVEVPQSVFTTLRAVIRGRKDCASWYSVNADLADNATKDNNAGHQYFINVLEGVLDTLQPKEPHANYTVKNTATSGLDRVTNMFEHLELEETDESHDMPEAIASVTRSVAYKLETSDIDISFAIYCFLKDATDIRLFVRRTWREFKRGEIGLQAAALTMNTALAMIERLNDEFEEAHPQFKATAAEFMHTKIVEFVYEGYCKQEEGGVFLESSDEGNDPFTYREVVSMLQTQKHEENLRLYTDEKRFLKTISQLGTLPMDMSTPDRPYKNDMVHKAAWMLMSQRRFETWAVFAMQILWDTQRELGPMLQIGSQLLGKTARELIESYQVYLNTEGLDKVGGLHKMFRSDMEARRNHIVAVALDVEFQPVTDQREEKVPWKVLELQGFSLLQCHPALCGLILADIRDEHHRTSFDMAGDQCQILVAAHLYNAAHQSEFLSKDVQWADMDWFIEQQGSDWIFVGARPQQGIEIARRLGLARGLGITRYAKDYKYPKSGLGSEGIHCVRGKNRRLDYLARLSQLSYERQGNPYKKISGSSRAKEDILVMLDALIKDYLGPEGASTKLSPLDTLCTFKDAVQMDEFALNFDVMEFYLRCMELLRKIQDHCLTHAPLDYPEEMFDKGIGMNTVTAELLHDLSGRPRFHGIMFPHAVTMLRNVIVEEGSAVLTKARARQHQKKLQHTETGNEVEPSFENPPEDDLPVKLRSQCGFMVFQDENGDCRMLFDSR